MRTSHRAHVWRRRLKPVAGALAFVLAACLVLGALVFLMLQPDEVVRGWPFR